MRGKADEYPRKCIDLRSYTPPTEQNPRSQTQLHPTSLATCSICSIAPISTIVDWQGLPDCQAPIAFDQMKGTKYGWIYIKQTQSENLTSDPPSAKVP